MVSEVPSKRQGPPPNNDNKKKQKRTKLMQARSVIVQNADSALIDGRLDVPSFVKSREFEIEQLENAMLKSKSSGKQRIFQSLPRILRRRTASHNVKRVPKRMRKRAAFEMQNDNADGSSTVSLKEKMKKKEKRKESGKFAMEQRKKQTDEEKSKLDRVDQMELDSNEVVTANTDDSNISRVENTNPDIVEMTEQIKLSEDLTAINSLATPPKGKQKFQSRQKNEVWLPTHIWHAKRTHLENIWGYSIPRTPTQKCYRATHRAAAFAGPKAGTLAWDKSYFGTLIVESEELADLTSLMRDITGPVSDITQDRYVKGYRCWEGMLFDNGIPIGPGLIYFTRQEEVTKKTPSALIRVHPSIFDSVHKKVSKLSAELNKTIYYDCRYSIGSIEVLGPQSTNSLISILRCVDHNSKVSEIWRSLAGLANPSSLPRNAVITMNVHDPRLFYPPHKPQQTKATKTSDDAFASLITSWPNKDMTNASDLFAIEGRQHSYNNQLNLKKLNKRRTTMKQPGKHLQPQTGDPHIPIILIRQQSNDGWTLLAPWGWILPFWYSLMHFPEVQVSGYTQQHQISYEHGKPYFPDDYPGTEAGHLVNWTKSKDAHAKWNSKPPGKRVSFDKVITGSKLPGEHGDPFQCDWNFLTKQYSAQLPPSDPPSSSYQSVIDSVVACSTQPSQTLPQSSSGNDTSGPLSASSYEQDLPRPTLPPTRVVTQAVGISSSLLNSSSLLSLSMVKIKYLQRGSPNDRARVYRIPDISFWEDLLHSKEPVDMNKYPSCPSSEYLIGYVTTGDFNLAEGCGSGIGSILTNHLSSKNQLCLVRNVGASTVRLARWTSI